MITGTKPYFFLLSPLHANHRTAEIGKDLWKSPSPARLFKTGPSIAGYTRVSPKMGTLGDLVQGLITLTLKNSVSCLNGISCILICAHYLFSCHWALQRMVCSLSPPIRYLQILVRSLLSFLSMLNIPNSLNFFFSVKCCNPLVIFVALH